MRMSYLALIFLTFLSCQAQSEKLIIDSRIIELSEDPVYPNLIEYKDGVVQYKDHFKYLDSIDIYGITYLSDGLKVEGLMVKPKKEGNYPCIIYNRGGNRDFGALNVGRAVTTLGEIAKEGYVLIASQYRGNAGGEGKEEFGGEDINDVLILTDVLKEVESANTEKIGMYGWSRGGMMTYIALKNSDNIKAAVVGGAESDLTQIDRPEMETNVFAELIPNYEINKKKELESRSAIYWANKFPKDVPILMLHGNSDWRVKAEKSLKLALEFEKYRIPYRLKIFEGGDHGIREFRTEVNKDVINWFDKYLKNDAPLPNMEYHGR